MAKPTLYERVVLAQENAILEASRDYDNKAFEHMAETGKRVMAGAVTMAEWVAGARMVQRAEILKVS